MNDKEQMEKDWCDLARKWNLMMIELENTAKSGISVFLFGSLVIDAFVVLVPAWLQFLPALSSAAMIQIMINIRKNTHRDKQRYMKHRQFCLVMRDIIRSV